MEQPLTRAQAERIIRQLASPAVCDQAVFHRPHCKQRMAQRGLDARDTLRILRTGDVSKAYFRDGEWRHQVKASGFVLAVAIVEVAHRAVLHGVTVWRKR